MVITIIMANDDDYVNSDGDGNGNDDGNDYDNDNSMYHSSKFKF